MLEFDVNKEPIYVFELDGTYLFKNLFEQRYLFSELSGYYNKEEHRFEISNTDFPAVQEVPEWNYHEPRVVVDFEAFGVVKEAYNEHADILRNAVLYWSREGYDFFFMKDPGAAEQAVEIGATRIGEMD